MPNYRLNERVLVWNRITTALATLGIELAFLLGYWITSEETYNDFLPWVVGIAGGIIVYQTSKILRAKTLRLASLNAKEVFNDWLPLYQQDSFKTVMALIGCQLGALLFYIPTFNITDSVVLAVIASIIGFLITTIPQQASIDVEESA